MFLDQAPRNEDRRDHPLTDAGWEEQEFMGVIGTLDRDWRRHGETQGDSDIINCNSLLLTDPTFLDLNLIS